jgi:hypothetical protein
MMDLSGTYALSSDIPQTYETKADLVSVLRAPLANFTEKRSLARGQSPILWIATYVISLLWPQCRRLILTLSFRLLSNCKAPSGRHHYIQELMKHIPVDSYGKCLHNKDVPKNFPGRYSSNDLSYLSTLIKDYKVVKFSLRDIITLS